MQLYTCNSCGSEVPLASLTNGYHCPKCNRDVREKTTVKEQPLPPPPPASFPEPIKRPPLPSILPTVPTSLPPSTKPAPVHSTSQLQVPNLLHYINRLKITAFQLIVIGVILIIVAFVTSNKSKYMYRRGNETYEWSSMDRGEEMMREADFIFNLGLAAGLFRGRCTPCRNP